MMMETTWSWWVPLDVMASCSEKYLGLHEPREDKEATWGPHKKCKQVNKHPQNATHPWYLQGRPHIRFPLQCIQSIQITFFRQANAIGPPFRGAKRLDTQLGIQQKRAWLKRRFSIQWWRCRGILSKWTPILGGIIYSMFSWRLHESMENSSERWCFHVHLHKCFQKTTQCNSSAFHSTYQRKSGLEKVLAPEKASLI